MLYSWLFRIWVIFSTSLYGLTCILCGLFSKRVARRVGRIWSDHLLWVGGMKMRIHGRDHLDPASRYVYISNHQSALDIPVLMSGLPHFAAFIAKKELFWIPIFGWGITVVGHISIDRSNARKARLSITRAVERLKEDNISLILFPEGTRSTDGTVGDFKQGAFTLAIEAGVPIVPIALKGWNAILPKGGNRINPGQADLYIGKPIEIDRTSRPDKRRIAQRVRNEIIRMMTDGSVDSCENGHLDSAR